MNSVSIVFAGWVGTAIMTAFVYCMAYLTCQRIQVVRILGTLLTSQTTPEKGLSTSPRAYWTGVFVHYLIGVGFSALYAFGGDRDWMTIGFDSALLFGFVAGLLAMIVWRMAFLMHPNPPEVPLAIYLPIIGIGHLFFALGMFVVFAFQSI